MVYTDSYVSVNSSDTKILTLPVLVVNEEEYVRWQYIRVRKRAENRQMPLRRDAITKNE